MNLKNQDERDNSYPGTRESNIELFRIVLMLMIITHHYVVNSGIVFFDQIDKIGSISKDFFINTIIAQLTGWGGKAGINGFILITGYFMYNKDIRIRKWLNLLFEVLFYDLLINGLFLLFGYLPAGKTEIIKDMLSLNILTGFSIGDDNFISFYLLLYLLIPFINQMIDGLSKRMHFRLLIILFAFFSGVTTLSFGIINTCSPLGCYITIYLLGAYCGKYGVKHDSLIFGLFGTVFSFILLVGYILLSDYLRIFFGLATGGGYYLVDGICKPLAVTIAFFLFICFKNIKICNCKLINRIASTTLGVLCIHANGATMRNFLWKDLLSVPDSQNYKVIVFAIRTMSIPPIIFTISAMADMVRQKITKSVSLRFLTKNRQI